MRPLPSALLLASAVAAACSPGPDPAREIDNVAAFARLYGVARYFYPSDAAAELDWMWFAVHGVEQVRAARSTTALADTLAGLFEPLGPGIVVASELPAPSPSTESAEPLVAWRYLGAGFSAGTGPYRAKRTHRATRLPAEGGFATLMQVTPGAPLRGKTIRLRVRVRATAVEPPGGAALWLRVDRPDGVMGFFDNMSDRMVRTAEWSEHTIEGAVAEDATNVAFGVMAVGAVTADFDAVELAVRDADADWTPVPVEDPGFEAEGDGGWMRTGPRPAEVTRPDREAPEGRQHLRIAPPPPGEAGEELFDEAPPTPGDHAEIDLGQGLKARVPLALADSEAQADPERQGRLDALTAALRPEEGEAAASGLDIRLADVVVAWNVFRHFYPYWTETDVDWDARLRPQLERAAAASGREGHRDTLRRLVAEARDGHGGVTDTLAKRGQARLPVGLTVIDGQVVVTSSAVPETAPVGAAVTTIDGTPTSDWLSRELSLSSGTPQWQRVRVFWPLLDGPLDGTIQLGLDRGNGAKTVTLTYSSPPPPETRPDPIVELEPGIWYADLTRTKMKTLTSKLGALAAARGVVFDVRGYPTDAGFGLLSHLLDGPEEDRWMHVAKIVGPFGHWAGWDSRGWDLKPKGPHIGGTAVFLTDGRAISYAESVMGYVADRKLGTIVGSLTAGTNGNVVSFSTPGAFTVSFTGMRVTGHDGTAPFHLIGVRPNVSVAPTIEDVQAGRDPVLERGLVLARGSGPL